MPTEKEFHFHPNYTCLMEIYKEYNGLADFQDDYGGIAGREQCFKTKWRRHLGPAGNK
jgi:hypothetical protein